VGTDVFSTDPMCILLTAYFFARETVCFLSFHRIVFSVDVKLRQVPWYSMMRMVLVISHVPREHRPDLRGSGNDFTFIA
jgi:hypothetical protein